MPYDPNAREAMRQGPGYAYEQALPGNTGASYIVPPYTYDTGPIDERTRMMLEAMDRMGGLSRMPHINPDIPVPDPSGALPAEQNLGDMNEWANEGDLLNMLQDKLDSMPKGSLRDLYNPMMPEEDAQKVIQQLLDGQGVR